jgi:hypothetical protein
LGPESSGRSTPSTSQHSNLASRFSSVLEQANVSKLLEVGGTAEQKAQRSSLKIRYPDVRYGDGKMGGHHLNAGGHLITIWRPSE